MGVSNRLGLHPDRQTEAARAMFRIARPGRKAEAERATEIAALPTVTWKGRRLYILRCHGETGRGPHDLNVPEALLWSLITLDRYVCPFHR